MPYNITATLGPASDGEAVWTEMLAAGVTSFRLNTSHLTSADLQRWLERLLPFHARSGGWSLVLDLQGSKWRLGRFSPFLLEEGALVEFVEEDGTDHPGVLPVPHADFFRAAGESSDDIILNDAKSLLRLETKADSRVVARVVRGGLIQPRKGITFRDSTYRSEGLGNQDAAVLETVRSLPENFHQFVRFAISYLRDGDEMRRYRRLIGAEVSLIAKLERPTALEAVEQIAGIADEVWLCRGDLGAEVGLPAMARAAHAFGQKVRSLPVPLLLAGQVLEHMTVSNTPTRAEVCALHDALAVGYAGFVLSDETAVGQNPVEACRAAAIFKT